MQCRFGDRWRAVDERTLAIEGVCTGGKRQIQLTFSEHWELGSRKLLPKISVDSETDWGPLSWAWMMTKCTDEEIALPPAGARGALGWGCRFEEPADE